ncbi:transposable element Tc1 transposase [Trichonephila clavipes]|nr:transposable element Tc1 transposase [Trichonephila clavipes]
MTNRRKRIAFEKDHIHKPLEFWRTVIFSDEGKFCIFGIKGCKLVWRKPCTALQEEHLVPTVKHGGGGVMVWGCMASNDVGNDEAHFYLNGYVNKQKCRIWSEANPQVYVQTPLYPEKLTVWCALWAGGIIAPYFFKNDEGHNVTVNGKSV